MSVRRIVKDGVLYTCIYGPDGDVLDMTPGLGDVPMKKRIAMSLISPPLIL